METPIIADTGLINDGHETENKPENIAVCTQMKLLCHNRKYTGVTLIFAVYIFTNTMVSIIMTSYGAGWFGDCKSLESHNNSNCGFKYTEYNFYASLFSSIQGVLCFLFAGYIGSITDSLGRKPILLLAMILYFIPRFIMLFYNNLWVYWGFVILFGIHGGGDAGPPALFSYISDVLINKNEMKTIAFAIEYATMASMTFLAAILAIIISYFWNNFGVFLVVDIVYVLAILYIIFLLPESLAPENKQRMKWINPFRPLLHIADNMVIFWVSIISIATSLPESGIMDVIFVFFNDQMHVSNGNKSNVINAIIIVTAGICAIFTSLFILPLFKKYGVSDLRIAFIGIIMTMSNNIVWSLIAMPFINKTYGIIIMIIGGILFGAGNALTTTALNSIISQYIGNDEQGKGFGIVAACKGITGAVAPFSFGYGYNVCKKHEFPYLPFLFAAGLLIAANLCLIGPLRRQLIIFKQKQQKYSDCN